MEIRAQDCTPKELYKLVTGTIVPRPIAFVSTIDQAGNFNVAPFSFFNAVSGVPPIVMFAISDRGGMEKDTLRNIRAHPEFVVNMVSYQIVQHMHDASSDFMPGVSEFDETGLTPIPARMVKGVAVQESPVHFECRLHSISKVGRNEVVFGEIVLFNLADDIVQENLRIDTKKYTPVARLAGNRYMTFSDEFSLEKHADQAKLMTFEDLLR
jgi:flavin reductase (DIM6/NTAB) family NADH-FMN oxidoreductase RutF